jgi:SEFIR domain-containing protein
MSASAPDTHIPHGVEELRVYGEGFAGREEELAALNQAWNEGMVRVFVLHAEGGAGKTRVVAKWLNQVRDDGWRGAGRVFVHSFYSQGSAEQRNASSELFFEEALSHFGHTGPRLTDPTEQGRTLARLLVEKRGLLVLDGIEPLQHPLYFDQGRMKDPAIDSLLRSLAMGRIGDSSGGGLCVVTSRQSVVELRDKIGRAVVQQPLDRLDAIAGAALLRQLEVRGSERELREAVEATHGHAYSLMLLGSYLRDATDDHDIRRRLGIPLLEGDEEQRYHARHLIGAYVQHLGESSQEVAVLRLLGFFDRPAEEKLLAVLREAAEPELNVLAAPLRDLSSATWRRVLRRLIDLRLIDVPASPSPPIDSHPLLREYFGEQLRTRFPEAWRAGHRRLFEHLCETTEYRPATLAGLQPLYQAVVHGCLAGLRQRALSEVYDDRILRGTGSDGFYSTRKLGAIGADLGAVACFFVRPWSTLAPDLAPARQAWLLGDAAFRLRILGRLTEAVEPMRAGLTKSIELEDWKNAAARASNLSELELMRGEISAAVATGEQSVTYADRSEDEFQQMGKRARLADTQHQAGRHDEAQALFEDAESRQAAWQPQYPRLYSLQGFWYCDLLLSAAERSAWQRWLNGETGLAGLLPASIAACDAVKERVRQWIEWRIPEDPLLDIALIELTLARAMFYKANSALPIPNSAFDHVAAAVDGLRASGQMAELPRGLLTRSWLRFLSGEELGCREDLDEAWEIAERGPMPLFQADIQLYRARLFRDRDALAEARRLIEKHGYNRRDGELADAEEAAKHWKDKELGVPTKVFVSYSHDSDQHSQRVLALSTQLRKQGVDASLDQYETRPPQGWPRWCEEQLRPENSEFVLVVCTEMYLNRIEGKVPADEGRGVFWEGSVIYNYLYNQKSNSRFIPILFNRGDEAHIPLPLQGSSYYRLEAFDLADTGYKALYRELTHQSFQKPPLGDVVKLEEAYTVRGGVVDEVVVLPPVDRKEVRSVFPVGGSALKVWQEKLAYLLEQEAIAVDPDQKFRLRKLIEEARQKIHELGG